MGKRIRVAAISDSIVVRLGLTAMLEPAADLIRFTAAPFGEPSTPAPVGRVDVTIIDVRPGSSVAVDDVIAAASRARSGTVLLYATVPVVGAWLHLVTTGTVGVLDFRATADELVRAILAAVPDARRVDAVEGADWVRAEYGLSRREADVLLLVGQGLTNERIGVELSVSVNTVKSRIRTAYRKLGLVRRAEAVRWCAENGLLPIVPARRHVA